MTTIREQYGANIVLDHNYRKGSILDQSGLGNDGTVAGTVQWTKGEKGRAIYFNAASNGYLSVLDSANLRPANITICVFGNFDTQTTSERLVYKRSVVNTNYDFFVNATSINLYNGTSTSTLVATTTDCNMLGVTVTSGQTPKFYKNGVKLGDGDIALTLNTTNTPLLIIGSESVGANINRNPFYEAIIFNVVLTQAEISQFYEEWLQEGNYDVVDINNLCNPSRNLILDGDMETAGTANWTSGSSAILTKETTTPHSGTQCLRVTYGGALTPYAQQTIPNYVTEAGKTYRVTGWARTDGVSPYARVFIGNATQPVIVVTTSTWTYFDLTRVASSTTGILLQAYTGGLAGQYCDFDDVTIQEASFADKSYITQGRGWNTTLSNVTLGSLENSSWRVISGTWSITDSLQKINSNQLLADANMEAVGTTNWINYYGNPIITKETTTPHSGTQCLRIAYTNTTNPVVNNTITTTIGKNYRIRGWCRGNGAKVGSVWISNGGTYDWLSQSTTDWQFFDIALKNTGLTSVRLMCHTATAGYVEFDDLELYEVLSEGHKISNVVAGIVYKPSNIAYGSWEFDLYKGATANVPAVMLTASLAAAPNDTGQNGYMIQINPPGYSGTLFLYRVDNGVTTTLFRTTYYYIGYTGRNSFKITRSATGSFSIYVKVQDVWTLMPVGSGTNPVTDNTYASSMFSVLDLDAGDFVRNFVFKPYVV